MPVDSCTASWEVRICSAVAVVLNDGDVFLSMLPGFDLPFLDQTVPSRGSGWLEGALCGPVPR